MKRGAVTLLLLLGWLSPAAAQSPEDRDALKRRLMEDVERRLGEERRRILEQVSKILDEELGSGPEAGPRKEEAGRAGEKDDLDDLAKEMEETRARLESLRKRREAIERRRQEGGSGEREAKEPPKGRERREEPAPDEGMSQEEAALLFQKSMKYHEQGKYDRSVEGFTRIFEAFPDEDVGMASAYNIACGYALQGKGEKAIEWLGKAVEHGFKDAKHIEEDTDLDKIRDMDGYKEIVRRLKSY